MVSKGENSGGDAVTFDSVLAGAKPTVKSVRISLRGDLVHEIEQLQEVLQAERMRDEVENRVPVAPKIAKRIVELTDQATAAEVEFTFRSIGRRAWRDLVAEHPPAEEEKKQGADFNTETFPAAAMAAACVTPAGASLEKFEQLRDGDVIGDRQWNDLWATVHAANTGGSGIPLSAAAFAMARGITENSESRGTTASPGASS